MLINISPETWVLIGGGLGGAFTEDEHRLIPQLIHYVEDGPDESSYKEVLPSGSVFPTSIIWWDSSSKVNKIVEKLITWAGAFPAQIVWNMYSGGVVVESLNDSFDYSGGNTLTPKVTRTYSL